MNEDKVAENVFFDPAEISPHLRRWDIQTADVPEIIQGGEFGVRVNFKVGIDKLFFHVSPDF